MIFVNLDQRDHQLTGPDVPDIETIAATPAVPDAIPPS